MLDKTVELCGQTPFLSNEDVLSAWRVPSGLNHRIKGGVARWNPERDRLTALPSRPIIGRWVGAARA
jgi:hypothetical protein